MTKREHQAREYAAEQSGRPDSSGWVDASERLPEDRVEVLVCHAGRGRYATAHIARISGRYPLWFASCGDMNEPTHWMKLPPVPSTEKN